MVGKKNVGGSTPMTVLDRPLMLTAFPMIVLSPPKTRRHAPKPSTIVGLTPDESSPAAKVRPRYGRTPSARNTFASTRAPERRTGSPVPTYVPPPQANAPNVANER